MKLYEAIIIRTRQLCKERNITAQALLSVAHLSSGALSVSASKGQPLSTSSIAKICRAFGITIRDFFNNKIFTILEEEE